MGDIGMVKTSSNFVKLIALDEHKPILRKKTLLHGFAQTWSYGDVLAKDSNGKLRKVAKTVLTQNETSATDLHVEHPEYFLVGDTVTLGGSTAAVSAIDVSSGIVTVDTALSGTEGDAVYIDGPESTAYAILAERDVDVTGTSDVSALVMLHGVVFENYVGNIDDTMKEELESRIWFKTGI